MTFRLRAKFLVKGINRMLNDDSGTEVLSHKFYKQPLIKYLASGRDMKPAYMAARNFSKNLIEVLKEEDRSPIVRKKADILRQLEAANNSLGDNDTKKKIAEYISQAKKELDEKKDSSGYFDIVGQIREELNPAQNKLTEEQTKFLKTLESEYKSLQELDLMLTSKSVAIKIRDVLNSSDTPIARTETVKFLRSLLDDAQNDVEKFKAHLEKWYDDTMERVTGWYKQRIQWITFFTGLVLAGIFNVDTIAIVKKLSVDPDARAQFVILAQNFSENEEVRKIVYGENDSTKLKQDFLKFRDQALTANNVLAIERKPVVLSKDQWADTLLFPVLGWLITAIALSLGAPFWFDLLNKLVKLRSSIQVKKAEDAKASTAGTVPVTEREG
jgi:hypothetical protein